VSTVDVAGAAAVGALAGYAVAVPVGAISLLILDTGMRRGLRPALAAGLGTAIADLAYAAAAAIGGSALARALAPYAGAVRVAAAAVLVAVAVLLLRQARRVTVERHEVDRGLPATCLRFLALTIVNPSTAASFAAIVLGMGDRQLTLVSGLAFVLAAFLASLSWQWVVAFVGAVLHRRLPAGARRTTSTVGAALIALLALRFLVG
jgi:arginine exporter protein ArgO